MAEHFYGFDHVDIRVASLAKVEAFYDRLMPELGLTRKRHCMVRGDEWDNVAAGEPYNTVEYLEPLVAGRTAHFIGFIDDASTPATMTRLAFRVASVAQVERFATELANYGALHVERSEDPIAYPAVFFEDPGGLKLEICARPPFA